MFSSPAIAGGILYLGTHEGKLVAVDLKTKTPAWEFQTDASRENGGKFTKADGTPNYKVAFTEDFYDELVAGVLKMQAMGTVLSSPVVADKVIYVGSTDGNLYALM
jgi:outer membrane protein assembly factor BamB